MSEQQMPQPNNNQSVHDIAIRRIEERKQLGIERYGTILQAFNGRSADRDLSEELLDAVMYEIQREEETKVLYEALIYSAMVLQIYANPQSWDGLVYQAGVPTDLASRALGQINHYLFNEVENDRQD